MRTTIDLPEDLHQIARSIARETGRSLSHAVADLLRRGLEQTRGEAEPGRPPYVIDAETGLPTVRSRRTITLDDDA
jgi:Arc/MetJ family transcription regulator